MTKPLLHLIPKHQIKHIIPGCATQVPGFVETKLADRLGSSLIDETFHRWTNQVSYSKGFPARIDPGHQMARFGQPGVTYDYKGKPKPVFPFTPSLAMALDLVEEHVRHSFNCVVLNSYAPGTGLYPHRDSHYIPQLGKQPVIAALSFGCTRAFRLHPLNENGKRTKGNFIEVPLAHGDLFVMYGECDEKYHHSIPEEPHLTGARVSLTFRRHLL